MGRFSITRPEKTNFNPTFPSARINSLPGSQSGDIVSITWSEATVQRSESARAGQAIRPSPNQTAVSERTTSQQNPVRITAIVQPSGGLYAHRREVFSKHGHVFGCNEKPSAESCGIIRARISCSVDSEHPSYYKHERCNDPGCPVCYTKFTTRIADAAIERIRGYKTVFGNDPISHLIFWPEYREPYANLKEAFRDASKMLKKMGVKGAVVWYHPYRIPDEIKQQLRRYKRENFIDNSVGFWQLAHDDVLGLGGLYAYIVPGPHFHAESTGYLMDVKEYAKLGIGGYKKTRRLDTEAEMHRVAHYVSTHACREFGKSTVRYFGKMAYNQLHRDAGTEIIENCVCEICGKDLQEHVCDENGNVLELKHEHVTRKKMLYLYWARGSDPPFGAVMKQSRHDRIWSTRSATRKSNREYVVMLNANRYSSNYE